MLLSGKSPRRNILEDVKENNMIKRVYLDLNKYIELSRIWHGMSKDEAGILDFITVKKNNGEMIFPISYLHIIELSKNANLERRKRLAEVMWIYSNGLIMVNRSEILNFEIDKSIEVTFHLLKKIDSIDFFCKNLLRGFMPINGEENYLYTSKPILNLLSLKIQDKEEWVDFVASCDEENRKIGMNSMYNNTKRITSSINRNRGILNDERDDLARNAQMAMLILDTENMVLPRLEKYGLGIKDLLELGTEKITRFYQSIPSFNIEYQLKMQAFKNKEKTSVDNDVFDIGFLSNVICYFDTVVTENYWANIVKQSKVDIQYNTLIETKLLALKAPN